MATSIATQNAFERAWDTYKKELNAKELQAITTPVSLDNVLSTARDICEKQEKGDRRKTIRLFQQLDKARERLEPFNNILAGLCKLPPYGGDLIWASVSLTLQFVKDNHDSFEAVLDYFTTIGKMMPLFDSLISTFDRSALVAPVGEALYIALIAFWVEAVKHYRAKTSRLIGRLVSSSAVNKKFQALKQDIEKQEQNLLKVSAAQHYADNKQLQKLVQYTTFKQVNDLIAPPRYSSDFNAADKKRYGNTCEWILTKEKYIVWDATKTSSTLIIYGQPGTGKTILSSYLISRFVTHSSESGSEGTYISLYHYFKLNDETKNTPAAAMRSILHQLYVKFHESGGNPAFDEELVKRISKKDNQFEDLWAVFVATVTTQALKVVVILDAIDECRRSKVIVREMRTLAASQHIKVIITGREQGEHRSECAKTGVVMHITVNDVGEDIASLVRHKVSKIERLQSPRLRDVKDRVLRDLSDKSNHKGMFLWAYLMCKDLKEMGNIAEIERLIERLPQGIEDLYVNILKRLSHLPQDQQAFSRHVLEWIVVSNRPLKFLELEQGLKMAHPELISMFEEDEDTHARESNDDNDRYPLAIGTGLIWSRKDIVRVCGSLVIYSGEADGDTIGLLHLTTKDFLSSPKGRWALPAAMENFLVDVPRSQICLGTACLELLNRQSLQQDPYFSMDKGILGTGRIVPSDFKRCYPLFVYAVSYWPHYFLEGSASRGPGSEVTILMLKVKTLLQSDFATLWLEHFVYQHGPELVLSTINRLSRQLKEFDPGLSKQLCTAEEAIGFYMRTIARAPLTMHLCLQDMDDRLGHTRRQQRIQEFDFLSKTDDNAPSRVFVGSTGWMHYEDSSDTLYIIESPSERLHVKRQHLKSAITYQPAGDVGKVNSEGNWYLKFAVASDCGCYLAASFTTEDFPSDVILTVLWKLFKPPSLKAAADWAVPVLIDRVNDQVQIGLFHSETNYYWRVRNPVVSFAANNTLITPSGIWSIEGGKLISRPSLIFEPTNEERHARITHTCFSNHGAARIVDETSLEVFTLEEQDGSYEFRLTHREDLPSDGELGAGIIDPGIIYALSANGKEIVVGRRRARTVWYVVIRNGTADFVELVSSWSSGTISAQFTKTEGKIIGMLFSFDTQVTTVVLWSLIESKGKPSHVDQVQLFKCHDARVQLSPISSLDEREEGAIVLTSSGDIHRLEFLTPWSEHQELELSKHRSVKDSRVLHSGRHLRLIVESKTGVTGPVTIIETWSIEYPPRHLSSTTALPRVAGYIRLSPAGKYAQVFCSDEDNKAIFYCDGDNSPERVVVHVPPGFCHEMKFSEDDKLIACVTSPEAHGHVTYTVHLLEADADTQFRHVTSFKLSRYGEVEFRPIGIAVSNHHVPVIAVYDFFKDQPALMVLELLDGVLQVTANPNRLMIRDARISSDGKYLQYDWERSTTKWPKLYPLPQHEYPENKKREMLHPLEVDMHEMYVEGNDLYQIRKHTTSGLLFLLHGHKSGSEMMTRRRVLGVLPDRYLDSDNNLTLVWPPADAEDSEVKVLALTDDYDRMAMIRTGIHSASLLVGEEWEVLNESSPFQSMTG